MKSRSATLSKTKHISIRLKEFRIPPARDCLVIGRKSPIGCVAMKRALALLHAAPFADIDPEDELVSNILIRESILLKVSTEKLTELILRCAKPMMRDDEILDLELDIEVFLEDQI